MSRVTFVDVGVTRYGGEQQEDHLAKKLIVRTTKRVRKLNVRLLIRSEWTTTRRGPELSCIDG